MHNGEDNRLTHALINSALKPALDVVEAEWRESWRAAQSAGRKKADALAGKDGRGALILIGNRSQDKFFSNGKSPLLGSTQTIYSALGLDFPNAMKDPAFFPGVYETTRSTSRSLIKLGKIHTTHLFLVSWVSPVCSAFPFS